MNRLTNILFVLSLILFGPVFNIGALQAQDNPSDKKAEHLISITKANLRTSNSDSAYINARNLLLYALINELPYYEANAKMLLGNYFMLAGNNDSSLYYFNSASTIFETIKDTVKMGNVYFYKSIAYKNSNDFDSMLKYQLKANELFTSAKDTFWYSVSNNYLGNNYSHAGNYPLALKHFQNSLDAAKLLGNHFNIGANYNAIGIVYRKIEDQEKEEEAYLNAIDVLEETNKSVVLGQAYNNLSEIYFDKGEVKKAFETLEKARMVYEDIGYPLGLCSYYSVLGYYHSTTNPPDNPKVIEYFNKSIAIAKKHEDNRQYADGTAYLGTTYMETGQLGKAKAILEKGLTVAEENELNPEIVKITEILAKVYSKSNQPKKAFHLLQKHLVLKDSLSGEDKIKEFTQLDLQYKFRQEQISDSLKNVQKELEKDFQHKKEIRDQQKTKAIFISISILVIIIAFFMFINSRKKKKQVKVLNQKNLKINDQKIQIEESAKKVDKAYTKLKELDEYKQSMTSMLVHDLKNPLNLLTNIDLVEDEKTRSTLIKNTSKQMLNLVLNLLDVNKAEASELELNKKEVGLSGIIQESSREVDYLSSPVNIKIVNKSLKDYSLQADHDILVRVFVNLFSNAIKFSPRDSSIIITTSITPDKQIRISIKDSGPGIAKEFHETIFEKFKQVEQIKSGEIKSTGLGLAFCKLAVESHGWEIGVDSEEGKGAEFWIKVKAYQLI